MAGTYPRRGMALVLALAATAIVSVLLSGILLLVVSHLSLTHTKSSYANAMNLAEAGINWELWKVSHDLSSADNTPATVEVPTSSGRSFTVHVEAYPSGGPWTALGPFSVISTGTVDGVNRTVRIVARGFGLAGLYALFGIDTLNIGGNATVNGASGTNNDVSVSGGPNLNGNFIYAGPDAGGDQVTVTPPGQVFTAPLAEDFPTVNELASLRAWEKYGVHTTLGVDFFATSNAGTPYNDNATIRDASGAAVSSSGYTIDWQHLPQAGTTLWDGTPVPTNLQGANIIVLRPGDYYLEGLDVQGNRGIFVDDREGVVNIWLGTSGATAGTDTINGGSIFFASQDSSNFHLYQGSGRTLVMEGTMDVYGSVFAYNGPNAAGGYWGSIIVRGDGVINGSVIGYSVTKTTGSCTINFPSSGGIGPGGGGPGPTPGEPIFYYGFDQSWEEVNPL
ncbi:MAG: hypothetical protein ACE149_02510 [Armatimonadota bacterium]